MHRAAGRTTQEHLDDLYDAIDETRSQLSLAQCVLLSLGFAPEDLADIIASEPHLYAVRGSSA